MNWNARHKPNNKVLEEKSNRGYIQSRNELEHQRTENSDSVVAYPVEEIHGSFELVQPRICDAGKRIKARKLWTKFSERA